MARKWHGEIVMGSRRYVCRLLRLGSGAGQSRAKRATPDEGPMQLAGCSTTEAAPPFAVFEGWAPRASIFVLIR